MGDVVNCPISLDSDLGRELIDWLARYRENLVDEKTIRKRYRFDDATWEKLGEDDELIRAVEEKSLQRIRDGSAKTEKSQLLVTKAPDVLSSILLDSGANAKHRIDSAKLLNDFSANGPGSTAPATDRFQIIIRLDADTTLRFDKSRKPDVDDVDPFNDIDTGAIAAIAAKNPTESGGGEPI